MDLNFDNERALLTQKRAELVEGLASIDRALAALNGATAKPAKGPRILQVDGVATDTKAVRAGRKPMSPKARKAARERMLAYWAAKRAEDKPAKGRKAASR